MTLNLLSIGINYQGDYKLNGCHEDVISLKKVLYDTKSNKGIYSQLIDSPGHSRPTLENIKAQIEAIYSKLKSGDTMIFTFSGHGGQVKDISGDEKDGKDECIYDCDLFPIKDDDLNKMLVEALPREVTLFVLLDCCHSGTGLDLPWIYKPFQGEDAESGKTYNKKIYCISGCRDEETSADAWIDKKPQGALTAMFCKVYSKVDSELLTLRWMDLITLIAYEVASGGYDQRPLLSCSSLTGMESRVDL